MRGGIFGNDILILWCGRVEGDCRVDCTGRGLRHCAWWVVWLWMGRSQHVRMWLEAVLNMRFVVLCTVDTCEESKYCLINAV